MGTDKKCNTLKNKVMYIWTTGYKVGAHNFQMIKKDKDLILSTWAQNKYLPKKGKYESRWSQWYISSSAREVSTCTAFKEFILNAENSSTNSRLKLIKLELLHRNIITQGKTASLCSFSKINKNRQIDR